MKQIIAFLVFWISFLSCQSEEINIYTQHVKEISKNKDGWNLVWSEEFEQESNIPNAQSWSLAAKEASPWNRYMSESYDQAYVKDGKLSEALYQSADGVTFTFVKEIADDTPEEAG